MLLFCFFRSPISLLVSACRVERSIPWNVFFPLEPPPPLSLSFSPSVFPPFLLLALNKYRFRLSELTPVSALYPLLTRIEFRTEDRSRSLSVAISSEARDRFSPIFSFLLFLFLFSVERCWPAGPEVRRCVCPKGDFDQTQSIPLNLHAHPRRAPRRETRDARMSCTIFHLVVPVATRLRVEN